MGRFGRQMISASAAGAVVQEAAVHGVEVAAVAEESLNIAADDDEVEEEEEEEEEGAFITSEHEEVDYDIQ